MFLFQSLLFANDSTCQLLRVGVLLVYRVVFGSGQGDCTILFHRVLQSQRHAIDRRKTPTERLLKPAQLILLLICFCTCVLKQVVTLLAQLKKLGQPSCCILIGFLFRVDSRVRFDFRQLGDLRGHVHLFDVFKDWSETFPLGPMASRQQGRKDHS